ncbi:unnamed protein product, partial [Wuchereria bancrofti]
MEGDTPDVLSFECYSFEPDTEKYLHQQLLHIEPMKLLYHLSDHTISLIEPHVPNNAILQGRIFTHQRVPKLDRNSTQNYLHWTDLNVAKDIHLFSRTYRITACDHHTRDFLTKKGIEVNEEEEIPMDQWIQNQERQQISSKNKGSEEKLEWSHEVIAQPSINVGKSLKGIAQYTLAILPVWHTKDGLFGCASEVALVGLLVGQCFDSDIPYDST